MNPWVRPLGEIGNTDTDLICFHYAAGTASIFLSWRGQILPSVRICPVHLPGRGLRHKEAPYTEFNAMIAETAKNVAGFLKRKFVVFGHSMGALIAYEVVKALVSDHQKVPDKLVVSACISPNSPTGVWWGKEGIAPYKREQPFFPRQLWSEAEILDMYRQRGMQIEAIDNEQNRFNLIKLTRIDYSVIDSYKFSESPPLKVPLLVLGGSQDSLVSPDQLLGWKNLSELWDGLHILEGGHFYLFDHGESFFKLLNARLDVGRAPKP